MLKKDVVFSKTLQKLMKMQYEHFKILFFSRSSRRNLIFSASSLSSIAEIRSKGKAWYKCFYVKHWAFKVWDADYWSAKKRRSFILTWLCYQFHIQRISLEVGSRWMVTILLESCSTSSLKCPHKYFKVICGCAKAEDKLWHRENIKTIVHIIHFCF